MSDTPLSPRPTQSHSDVVKRLRAEVHSVIGEVMPEAGGKGGYALLDFPNHSNVGDSAIFTGEMNCFEEKFGRGPRFTNHAGYALDVSDIPDDSLLLLHGGGNFGDIYPRHQTFREDLMRACPGRRVIQLPQSLHYDKPEEIEATAQVIRDHGAFTLLTRDVESYDLARTHFDCTVRMSPDMAFSLGVLQRTAQPSIDILLMLRKDVESSLAQDIADLSGRLPVEDWLEEPADTVSKAVRAGRLAVLRTLDPRAFSRSRRRVEHFRALSEMRVQRGIDQLSRARVVVTDRLHVHIVSTLMGVPHVFLDNSYGKIHRFSAAFDTRWSGCRSAKSLPEAIALAEELLRDHSPVPSET